MKIVVFDLDETLGYFVEFGIFWDSLSNYLLQNNNYKLTQDDFNKILDLYPECLRPNIIHILTYLKNKKIQKCCHKMMIYTNNQGPEKWANQLINYFENKMGIKLFDQIIAAFKVNGQRVEICRSSHNKSHTDLIKCTKLPLNTEICFLDDIIHPEMYNKNVYYINIKPYSYDLGLNEYLLRFTKNKIGYQLLEKKQDQQDQFITNMLTYMKQYNYIYIKKNMKEYDIDKNIGREIMQHLQQFFKKSLIKSKTKNLNKNKKNKTVKIHKK
jgi:uncharacterized protein (DUF486 family)